MTWATCNSFNYRDNTMIHDDIYVSYPWESHSLFLYLIRAFVDERQMFRTGHKERRKRLTVITRFQGAANREEHRNWRAAREQERRHGLFLSLSFFLSPPSSLS